MYIVLSCHVDEASELVGIYDDIGSAKEAAEEEFDFDSFSWMELLGCGVNKEYDRFKDLHLTYDNEGWR